MKKAELAKKTRQELMEIAQQAGLVGRSKMNKEELVVSLASLLKEKKPVPVERSASQKLAAKAPQVKKTTAEPQKVSLRVERKEKEATAAAPTAKGKAESWQEKVEDTKYYLGAEERGFVAEEELPASYGDNKIVLMVRDPHWAYVYWEINNNKIAEAKRKLQPIFDQSSLILRVYDVTNIEFDGTNATSWFDIDIPDVLGNWYVNLGSPNRSFCIDIGYRKPDRGIFTLSRSNRITSPRDTFSEVVDEEWAMSAGYETIYAWSGGVGLGTSAELAERLKRGLEKGVSSGSVRGLGPEKIPSRSH